MVKFLSISKINKFVLIFYILFILITANTVNGDKITFNSTFDNETNWFFEAIDFYYLNNTLLVNKSTITIAIIDSGFNVSLSSLKQNTWININEIKNNDIDDDGNGYVDDYFGWDFTKNIPIDETAKNYTSHASYIAHLLGGKKISENQFNGMLSNVSMLNIRILDESNQGYDWNLIKEALNYSLLMESDIIILASEFLDTPPEEVKTMFNRILDADVPLITIAGNQGTQVLSYPAQLNWTITVGAIQSIGENNTYVHANYSNVGPYVDIVAPGTDIISFDNAGKQREISGTSFAAPFVAGTIATLKILSSISNDQLKDIILSTATQTGDCYQNGAGILNFTKALQIIQKQLPLPTNPEKDKRNCSTPYTQPLASFHFINSSSWIFFVLVSYSLAKRKQKRLSDLCRFHS